MSLSIEFLFSVYSKNSILVGGVYHGGLLSEELKKKTVPLYGTSHVSWMETQHCY